MAEKRGDFRLKHLPLRIKAEGLQVIEVEDLGEPQVLLPVEHIVFLIVGAVHAAEVNRIPANPVLGIKKKHIILRVIRPGRHAMGVLAASGTEHPVHASDDIRIENGLQILMTLEMSYIVIFEEFFRN